MNHHCGPTPAQRAEAIRARYGRDRTFSVPILMTAALAGLVPWREVPALPFELACFPQSWFRFLRLPVVSYALPALIAIGQVVAHHRPSWNPLVRLTRHLAVGKSLRVLGEIQPPNGGYLEATPLTAFVTLALASIGHKDHPVVQKCVSFMRASVRPDGSWPIDTNLATWVTTLAVNALAAGNDLAALDTREEVRNWLEGQQFKTRHPFTGTDPGGWGWTDLPGSVPDTDDTPGAMLALANLGAKPNEAGVRWLLDLQNNDGGWPTFCRGWGRLPFDRSGPDLTAHALRALARSGETRGTERGFAYLARTQRPDGSWLPLWFGHQDAPGDENPVYGTTRVLAAYRDCGRWDDPAAQRAVEYLLKIRNADGGWGGAANVPSQVEETALAIEVLPGITDVDWLLSQVEAGALNRPSPIGFYFAKLWYYERLYPVIFTVAALGRVLRSVSSPTPAT